MASRPIKRQRRAGTEDSDELLGGIHDWAAAGDGASNSDPPPTRPRRGTTSATVDRSPEDARGGPGIRITVKAPPSKLREATSGGAAAGRRGNNISVNSRDTFEGGEIVVGARAARKKAIVEESSEEEEEEEEEEELDDDDDDDDADDDVADEDVDVDEEDDEDEDAEGEEDDEMMDAPPPPPTSKGRRAPMSNPNISVTPAEPEPTLSKVGAKDIAMQDDEDDDEELSELSSGDEEDENDEEDGGEEDAEGEEEEEEMGDEDAEGEDDDDVDDDDDDDSDDETPGMSRDHTPDLSKLTRRQRAAFEEYEGGLMALSNEAQKKKHLTAEEHAMRRAEMARRRKNLSEKRNEEEKMDTINRLLKKQAPKRRGRAADANAELGDGDEDDYPRASKLYTRYVQSFEGPLVAVPDEWLDSPVGEYFSGPAVGEMPVEREWSGRMVEEVK